MHISLPPILPNQQRVVIIGAGFGGLRLARKLPSRAFQVVLIDRFNYHQFQPLLYQVATSGVEPSSISFPLRKIFHHRKNVIIRIAEVLSLFPHQKEVNTSIGRIPYDILVLAQGATTHYFNMEDIERHAFPMKSVPEALLLRNTLLEKFERALTMENSAEKQAALNIVVVGGGPTGVELAGTLAEMKKKILPRDFPELDFGLMQIYLLEASPRLLNGMSEESSQKVSAYLKRLGVDIKTETAVTGYDGVNISLKSGKQISSRTLIWAAGVRGNYLPGLPGEAAAPASRIRVDEYNRVSGLADVYAIGDIAFMPTEAYPKGHPQVAPAAIQQADAVAFNLAAASRGRPSRPFRYRDKGSMATVGRNLAVAEMGKLHLGGLIAWLAWMAVHLFSIVGVKNKIFIFLNWIWQYFTYDSSLRLIIKPSKQSAINPSA
jgi:NADH dehydrogenase